MWNNVQWAIAIPIAMFCLMIGWLAVLVNGRRPFVVHVRGLGIEVRIGPCSAVCPQLKGTDSKEVPYVDSKQS